MLRILCFNYEFSLQVSNFLTFPTDWRNRPVATCRVTYNVILVTKEHAYVQKSDLKNMISGLIYTQVTEYIKFVKLFIGKIVEKIIEKSLSALRPKC